MLFNMKPKLMYLRFFFFFTVHCLKVILFLFLILGPVLFRYKTVIVHTKSYTFTAAVKAVYYSTNL